jgi:cytosolic carboxypeptidase protein 5
MELITLSATSKITETREEYIEGLFTDKQLRPFVFDKPTIFLSCRVHPGETPASYVLDGIMKFLST